MKPERKKLHERLSVALDAESVELLEKLQSKLGTSKSGVVRKSLDYLDVVMQEGNISPKTLRTIINLRSRADTLIFDLGLFQAFLDEIGEGSEELKENIREIGKGFYREYCDMGISKPLECLKHLENTNLFSLIIDSENSFVLIPRVQKMDKFLKIFFEGYLEQSPYESNIIASYGKIRIKITKKD